MSRNKQNRVCVLILHVGIVFAALLVGPLRAAEPDMKDGAAVVEATPAETGLVLNATNNNTDSLIESQAIESFVAAVPSPTKPEPLGQTEPTIPAQPVPAIIELPDHAGILTHAREYALGMIETGNKDGAIGGLGEISRFQIMPSVWKSYSDSRSYGNIEVASEVARQHWLALYHYFKNKAGREPGDLDMYVLWNTRHGYYAARGFSPDRLHPVVRDRAQRFANLVEDSVRRESKLAMADVR